MNINLKDLATRLIKIRHKMQNNGDFNYKECDDIAFAINFILKGENK